MCGIAGAWWGKPPQDLNQRIDEALHQLRYRGPNDAGRLIESCGDAVVALLHKRLSIIDLTDGGHQPKSSADGRYSMVYNGEIYNYRELRQELRQFGINFVTESDSEVLLNAWIHWGKDCLPRLIGMFAFVVFDRLEMTLTCIRDAFGIKPFFYSADSRGFIFASEISAITSLSARRPKLDWQRSYDYLVHGDYDSQARTFIENVVHLQAAHFLHINLISGVVSDPVAWWKPVETQNSDISFADASELVRAQFLESIRYNLRSDVPLGAALSGGIDSSAVVCAMRYLEPQADIHTFSFISDDSLSEEKWVDKVNIFTGARAHKVRATGYELAEDLDDMLLAQGEPFGSTSIYAQYRVFKLAKEAGITVTLDGQGADELMAGYHGYPGQRLQSLIEIGRPLEAFAFSREWAKWPNRTFKEAWMSYGSVMLPKKFELIARQLFGRNPTPDWLDIGRLSQLGVRMELPWENRIQSSKGRRVISQLIHALTQRGLPALLRHGDRNSMRFSVESRVPFLTLPLATLVLSLPENYLISNSGETKSIFRTAMKGIVPDEILNRKDKIGFVTPELGWLQQAAPIFKKWMHESDDIPFLRKEVMLQYLDDILKQRRPFTWQAWRWINFVRWISVNNLK